MSSDPNPYASPQSEHLLSSGKVSDVASFGDGPVATFEVLQNDQWFGVLLHRRAQRPVAVAFTCAIAMGAMLPAITLFRDHTSRAAIIGGAAAIAVGWLVGPLLPGLANFPPTLNRFRRSPIYLTIVRYRIFREGLVLDRGEVISSYRWSVFPSARRFADGIHLTLDDTPFAWIPFAGLTEGNIANVDAVLRGRIPKYRGASR